jgi:hypothetical protein
MAPVLSTSEPTHHCKLYNLLLKKTILNIKLNFFSLESAVYTLYYYLNPIFLDSSLPHLLSNQFLQVLCIASHLHVKKRDIYCTTYSDLGNIACAIK